MALCQYQQRELQEIGILVSVSIDVLVYHKFTIICTYIGRKQTITQLGRYDTLSLNIQFISVPS